MNYINEWVKTCLHKKKLTSNLADIIVSKSNGKLRKYYCPHCFNYHLTSQINKGSY